MYGENSDFFCLIDHYEGEEKLWKDESLEKPYFADVSSSDSDKENTDSDEELKRAVFKGGANCAG